MSYIPIDFKNWPTTETPVSAENLNYIQQGIVLGVDRSRTAKEIADNINTIYVSGELNGKDGERGPQGPPGPAGRSFEIDGFTEKLADLPPAGPEYLNQIWVTYEFGHLHFCDGTQWLDWGQFVGVQGEQGPQGPQGPAGVFDPNSMTGEQLANLHGRLYAYDQNHYWGYKTTVDNGKKSRFKVADLNLDLEIRRTGTNTIGYYFYPNNTSNPATYYVKRLSNYDLIAWESTVTSGYQAQVITSSGFALDASGYLPGRELTQIQVIDPVSDMWYTIDFTGLGNGVMFIDVKKRQVQGRQVVIAT